MKKGKDADAQREFAKRPSRIQHQIDNDGWRDCARELRALGFKPAAQMDITPAGPVPLDGGDFLAQNDGFGPWIPFWFNKDHACPFPEMLVKPKAQQVAEGLEAAARAAAMREREAAPPLIEPKKKGRK